MARDLATAWGDLLSDRLIAQYNGNLVASKLLMTYSWVIGQLHSNLKCIFALHKKIDEASEYFNKHSTLSLWKEQ